MKILLLLFAAHALCDFPLQNDFLSRGKNYRAPLPGVPWWQCLFAHALIQAGAVCWITGSVLLALLELVIHTATDYAKCAGWFDPLYTERVYGRRLSHRIGLSNLALTTDQFIHYGCKVLWAAAVLTFGRIW